MLSYSELQNAIKRLEQENNILQGQKKTVIALNPRSQAFEYIGEPQLLNAQLELNTIDQIIQAIKLWLNNPSNDSNNKKDQTSCCQRLILQFLPPFLTIFRSSCLNRRRWILFPLLRLLLF